MKRFFEERMMKKIILLMVALFLLTSFSPAHAELKTFVKEYTYQASEYDNKVTCRILALEQVKRLLLEELGTYLESETDVKNFQIVKDQIKTLTAGIVRAEIVDERWDDQNLKFWIKARMTADPEQVVKSVERLMKDREKASELITLRKRNIALLEEVEQLKKNAKTSRKINKKRSKEYASIIQELMSLDYIERGNVLLEAHNYQEALKAFNTAIEITSKNSLAYFYRGRLNYEINNRQQALKDMDKAIELNPKSAYAFGARCSLYKESGDYKRALRDCNSAIELVPDFGLFYNMRADICFASVGNGLLHRLI